MVLVVTGGGSSLLFLYGATLYKPCGATASNEETVEENKEGLCCVVESCGMDGSVFTVVLYPCGCLVTFVSGLVCAHIN